jgi:hypothetical protein
MATAIRFSLDQKAINSQCRKMSVSEKEIEGRTVASCSLESRSRGYAIIPCTPRTAFLGLTAPLILRRKMKASEIQTRLHHLLHLNNLLGYSLQVHHDAWITKMSEQWVIKTA